MEIPLSDHCFQHKADQCSHEQSKSSSSHRTGLLELDKNHGDFFFLTVLSCCLTLAVGDGGHGPFSVILCEPIEDAI